MIKRHDDFCCLFFLNAIQRILNRGLDGFRRDRRASRGIDFRRIGFYDRRWNALQRGITDPHSLILA